MRVFFRVPRRTNRALPVVYQETDVTFCCAEMQRQWGKLIGFGVRGYKRSTSRDVSLFSDRAQVGGKIILEVTPISACPFCGEAVEPIRLK